MTQPFYIRKVAVLGGGVMGAQIAAHLINANVPVLLFDLPATDSDNLNQIVLNEIQALIRLMPPAFTRPENVNYLQACNYAQDLPRLAECDLIIEAVAENMQIKLSLYEQIIPYIQNHTLFVTNTSGLSINHLSQALPPELRSHFFGMHFFNPPRYMTLVELIPSVDSDLRIMEQMEAFLVTTLGKGIVYSQDTPNFVANRIGIFSMMMTLHYAEQFNIGLDVVDALTGPLIGRPKSATLRTADVVGLDTFAHAVATMTNGLPDDPWHSYFKLPTWLQDLINAGSLGQKTRRGVYQKQGDTIVVYDISTKQYRPANGEVSAEVQAIFAQEQFSDVLLGLRKSSDPQAQFLWACFREVFHYSAYHVAAITSTVRDADFAMRWGFGWKEGPFEAWQHAGWATIAQALEEDIKTNRSAVKAGLPAWVANVTNVYTPAGAFAPEMQTYLPRRPLPVYQRQLYPELMPEESTLPSYTLFENHGVRLWHTGDDIAILSFKPKLGAIDNSVLDGISMSLELAAGLGRGLVLWNNAANFSVGANLRNFLNDVQQNKITDIEKTLENFQKNALALRYSTVPTIAAVRGFVLGGGCELMLHCARIVAALESTIGLVEASVGLVPAGGGCSTMVQRAWQTLPEDPYPLLEKYYLQVAAGLRTTNGQQAQQAGYLHSRDHVAFNPYEILYLAKQYVIALQEITYRPQLPLTNSKVFAADYREKLLQAWKTKYPNHSEHDEWIARELSYIFGGPIPETVRNVHDEILRRERESFISLVQSAPTQARIEYMLKMGKPLAN